MRMADADGADGYNNNHTRMADADENGVDGYNKNKGDEAPLLQHEEEDQYSSKPLHNPTGNEWTSVAHVITGVIGTGVLSLAWSVAQLGWIAGPLTLFLFAVVALISAFLVSNCHRYPDPDNSLTKNSSFEQAVQNILGRGSRKALAAGIVVNFNFFKVGLVYTIASAVSMRAIQKSNCYHKQGHGSACEYGNTSYMLIFGTIQVLFSQIPNFHGTLWLSIIAAAMSFAYSIIGSGLGLAKAIGDGKIQGSITGVPAATPTDKVLLVAQALGDIAFSFPFSLILLNIQSTLKTPPLEKITMNKASVISISMTTFFYVCCGAFGYAAFGNATPGNILTGFGFYEPYWLIDFANVCIVIHLIGAYQVFTQPLFANFERWYSSKFPESGFGKDIYKLKLSPALPAFRLNLLRLVFRTAYVVMITGIAMMFPYFNQVMAVSGAITFWPIVIYFPVEMYCVQKNVRPWTSKWLALRLFTILCLLVTIFALFGSIQGLIAKKFGK